VPGSNLGLVTGYNGKISYVFSQSIHVDAGIVNLHWIMSLLLCWKSSPFYYCLSYWALGVASRTGESARCKPRARTLICHRPFAKPNSGILLVVLVGHT